MKDYQERVMIEWAQLDERRLALARFFDGAEFKQLPVAEQHRLVRQSAFMDGYLRVLTERIAAFEKEK